MKIALIDPFFDESHRVWAKGLQEHSIHLIDIYYGSAHNWKWKMAGGALEMASQVNQSLKSYDLFLVTDMLHLPLFKSLLIAEYQEIPDALYFHENQITYPWSPTDEDVVKDRDRHYGFINYCSTLIAERVFFNSRYHMDSFLSALPLFLKPFPDRTLLSSITEIAAKSLVLPLGLNLPEYMHSQKTDPVFIWNHRWEYDKNPELFFNTLMELKDNGTQFQLIVTGKSFQNVPDIFNIAREYLADEIIHYGFVQSKDEYLKLLSIANIIFVTSYQDFFGISIVEALAAGCYPVLPDRLSYKEHIPTNLSKDVFYKNEDCKRLLLDVIRSEMFLESTKTRNFVRKYDWQNMVDSYDTCLEDLVPKKNFIT